MKNVSEQRLVSALAVTSRLIGSYGDAYWPVFERLEQELTILRERKLKLEKYQSKYKQTPQTPSLQICLEAENE